jgi:hypothetical protein
MDVVIDGQPNFEFQGLPKSVFSAVSAIGAYLSDQGRSIMAISVDGEPINAEDITQRFADVAPSQIQHLEIKTEVTATLVHNCIDELLAVLPDLTNACHNLAEVFQSETPEDGFEPFQKLAMLWGYIKQREMLIINALSLDMNTLSVDGVALAEMHNGLNTFLLEAAEALKEGDCVTLGDLLEYELAPRADQEMGIVALLKQHASG